MEIRLASSLLFERLIGVSRAPIANKVNFSSRQLLESVAVWAVSRPGGRPVDRSRLTAALKQNSEGRRQVTGLRR